MWFYLILTWLSFLIQLCFCTISLAAGLYYLAELVEEYTVIAKKSITAMILITTSCLIGCWLFEDLPLTLFVSGIISQSLHWMIIQTFPFTSFTSPTFIMAVIFVIVNHYLAFTFFSTTYHTFTQVLAYFTLCLWLVPFALFVSLSANENVLPTVAVTEPLLGNQNDCVTNYFSRRGKKYGLLSLFNYAKESLLPQRNKKSF
ncbi:protein TEX261 isoform X2 [Chrysoperla carnea]|uniref:protein TEX261 isoform X2 n=1 Tax=Chrysoperla carnea TaxID=189513 RepID=UPI001D07A06B|nr:protein TEX261 isoform X2 [Chrysoperla carnea]